MDNKEIRTIIGLIEEAEQNYILNDNEKNIKAKLEGMLQAKKNEVLDLVSEELPQCNKSKWGDCECENECRRGLKK